MSYGKNRALPGKVRLVHMKSRAARVVAAQHIAESFDANGFADSLTRFVPIRHRADFLPSLGAAARETESSGAAQLDLPLQFRTGSRQEVQTAEKQLCGASSSGDFCLGDSGISPPVHVEPSRQAVQEPSRRTDSDLSRQPARQPVPKHVAKTAPFDPALLRPKTRSRGSRDSRFTPAGFLRGCVLGGAAAAVFLLVAYAIYAVLV